MSAKTKAEREGPRRNGLLIGDDGLTAVERRNALMRAARASGHATKQVAPPTSVPDTLAILQDQIRSLRAQIAGAAREALDTEYVKRVIIKLVEAKSEPPQWLLQPGNSKPMPGVPTLFASDWHWGEVVDPKQVGGVNSFNLEIAQRRARALIENAIALLEGHVVNPAYPGIVFALGGDMISGDIHEELRSTNEVPIMPVVIDLFGTLIWCISKLADHFGHVFVPCVTGNHGRNTQKIQIKDRNFTSFDWLVYTLLAKHFEADSRITFEIPDGPDCLYKVYGHRYLLTHGDQFRGGDGMIGALGPIIRGDHRKRSRNGQIGMSYDTMLLGHWHQLLQLQRLIVNGSLKGYCEYANANNFGYEPPRQALWLTHPEHGITLSMPVNVERGVNVREVRSWVSIRRTK